MIHHITGTPVGKSARILEALRLKIAEVAGVTLIGNRLTVRFRLNGELVDAHAVLLETSDSEPDPDLERDNK